MITTEPPGRSPRTLTRPACIAVRRAAWTFLGTFLLTVPSPAQDPAASAKGFAARLSAPEPSVRSQAEQELLKQGSSAVAVCAELAASPSLATQLAATRVLLKLASQGKVNKTHLSPIREALRTSDNCELRAAYCTLIPRISAQPLEELLAALDDQDRAVKASALRAMSALPQSSLPEKPLTQLRELETGDPLARLYLKALKRSPAPKEVNVVASRLNSPDHQTVSLAAEVLGGWKSAESAEPLAARGFSAKTAMIREACFAALAQIGAPGYQAVSARAEAPAGSVRELAAEALSHFTEAVPRLMKILENDPYPRARQAASRSLQRLAGKLEDPRFFYPYDAPSKERERVVLRWREHWKSVGLAEGQPKEGGGAAP